MRIWHWLDALTVIGLISTFFLRESLVSHSRFLIQRLNESGMNITDAQSRPIISQMVDQLWTWHIYMGYVLTALFIWRMILIRTDKTHPVAELRQLIATAREHMIVHNVHRVIVKLGYLLFYFLQFLMIISGFILAFSEKIHLSEDAEDWIHEGHELVMWFFLAFTVAHIAGVFFAENTTDAGIVSSMINGKGTNKS